MLQRMTNLKRDKDFVCLTWARRPGVAVCWVGSASWRFKFLLEEVDEITHGKQSKCHLLLTHHSSGDRYVFLDFLLNGVCVWERVCVPLFPVCVGCQKSVIGPWDWIRPAPGCPGCDVGGHGQKNCPSNYAVPPWPAAALPPVIYMQFCISYQKLWKRFSIKKRKHV